jgi:hypothetical protein
MKKNFTKLVFGLLALCTIIVACGVNFDKFWSWLGIELCLVGVTYGWYKLFNLEGSFSEDDDA